MGVLEGVFAGAAQMGDGFGLDRRDIDGGEVAGAEQAGQQVATKDAAAGEEDPGREGDQGGDRGGEEACNRPSTSAANAVS